MSELHINRWGPRAWKFMHTISYCYPVNPTSADRQHVHDYLFALCHVLPCKKCRNDFEQYLQTHLIHGSESKQFQSKQYFIRFLVDAHNHVNKRLGKRLYSYREVDQIYTTTNRHALIIATVCAVVVLVGVSMTCNKCKMKSVRNTPRLRLM